MVKKALRNKSSVFKYKQKLRVFLFPFNGSTLYHALNISVRVDVNAMK